MDKYGSVDQNWYSSEAQRHERENAEKVLKEKQELEEKYKKERRIIIEKTICGTRKRYVKKTEL